MAFNEKIENPLTGHENEYWRLTRVNFDIISGVCEVTFGGYKDAQARQDGLAPETEHVFSRLITDVITEQQFTAWIAVIYNRFKKPVLDEKGDNINIFTHPWKI